MENVPTINTDSGIAPIKLRQGVHIDHGAPTKPIIIVKVIPNRMEATLLLHPSSTDTLAPRKEDLLSVLEEQGIVAGINYELIDDLCVKPVFYHIFVIARGKPAETGADGHVDYLINTAVSHRPTINEDGIADYKNINTYRVVEKGQELCIIHPAELGDDGMDVLGNVLPGKYGRAPIDPAGVNTMFNDEKTILYATIDGRISVQYGVVSVIEVLTITENVDNATGNIEFVGDVVVGGDIVSGFTVKCGGSIVVHGSVEGAVLEAGTDINVSTGMLGMDKGAVYAGGSIKCKFIQNCTVRATGNIYADSVLFSDVECGGDLELMGRKAALIGGKIKVGGKIVAKHIGTVKHTPTEITMCVTDTEIEIIIRGIQDRIKELDTATTSILQMLTRYEEMKQKAGLNQAQVRELLDASKRYSTYTQQREEAKKKLEEIRREQARSGMDMSYVECIGRIYPNTKFIFGNDVLNIEEEVSNAKVCMTEEGIVVRRLRNY